MSARRLAREVVVQTLYEMQLAKADPDTALRSNLQRRSGGDEARRYAERLLREILAHRRQIDDHIRGALENWSWERMAVVDRSVLEMATVELMQFPDVPLRVVIDEAVQVVRKFGSAESGAFVNGVLDRIARTLGERSDAAHPES
jgi:N utilization substance protein B